MKAMRLAACLIFVLVMMMPATSEALGIELAVGGWNQEPDGYLAHEGDRLEFDDDLNYDTEFRGSARAKIDLPLLFPNVYLMYTPLEFEASSSRQFSFTFGNRTYSANVPFQSRLSAPHLDLALYYGIPALEEATLGVLNIELGINARAIALEVEAEQPQNNLSESEDLDIVIPMVYVAMQLRPIERIGFDLEGRGIAYSGNHFYSVIGRVRVKVFGPMFVAAGWRHDDLEIDEDDVIADAEFSGPFAELGLEF